MGRWELKSRTAHSLKWNVIDRLSTQALYAITGIVLARKLSPDDFGLVGAILVFQAFASLLVDSGFAYALIQRRRPTKIDYSTVLWFNLAIATLLYIVLFACAPLIADCFQDDVRLVSLSRVMFLSLILNASAIVQTNRLTKAMEMRPVAVANSLALAIGGAVGIALAVTGFGAWALVWQTLTVAAVKSLVLWTSTRWRPLWRFSWTALRSYFALGSKMMFTSFLNTVFVNIYSFFVGHFVGMGQLGYYTQGDKWSKMGVTSVTQVLTSSFLPALSVVQDQPERFRAIVSKINRFTSYLLFPAMIWLIVMATPIFHALFGTIWDPSISLFCILLLRGIFVVFNTLYTNYLLALGHGGMIVRLEVFRDVVAVAALTLSFPYLTLSSPADPVEGVRIMLYGQLAATVLTWIYTLWVTCRRTSISLLRFFADMAPYLAETLLICPPMILAGNFFASPWLQTAAMATMAIAAYLGVNYLLGSKIQREILSAFGSKL